MGNVEEAQEQMKADMEAMKEQMATMMEAMMSMKKIMEANTVAVAATSAVAKVNFIFNIYMIQPVMISKLQHATLANNNLLLACKGKIEMTKLNMWEFHF